ncbi:hypothetical protein GCM10010981_20420 [Dyella nitratireducens]|uniref:Glycosyltransferase RgtA/B/C/D-like domain-containing protein n=1 Tax=Dyella nitratireducens TaxID=1849580 RepID=A0ABQ1FY16_9GAMM|nr:hypothetical protein GCM10010981_20420 [Dyella nitratireducens]GLQ42895.1 hypothetical protein GCM10007902_27450 [Dyella nitratireducens]
MLVVLGFGLKKPDNNWDLIGYVAVALSADGYRGARLNEETYATLQKGVDADTFQNLTTGPYRETVFKDPSSLAQQLPFYRIRVLYVGLIRLVHAMGADYLRSAYIVSATFAALSVLLLAVISRQAGAPLIAVPLVVLFVGLLDVARLSTPDAMACFFSLLTMYGLARKTALVFVVASLLPLIRTDFLLLSLLVLGYTFVTGKRMHSVAALVVAVVLYLLVTRMCGAYGWLTLFNMSLISKTPYPASLVPSHVIGDYLRPYISTAYGFTMHPHFVIYGLAVFWLLTRRRVERTDPEFHRICAFLLIPLGFVLLHLLLFPADTYRFFIFAASLAAIWLLGQIRSAGAPRSGITREA